MIYVSTRAGSNHQVSEDAVLVGQEILRDNDMELPKVESGFVCVADGVGGNSGGEKASQFVLESLSNLQKYENLYDVLREINNNLISQSARESTDIEMATTLTGVCFEGDQCKLIHIGNTRLYVKQGSYLKQLTSDHTTYNWLKSTGQLDAAERCKKSEITNCFGGGHAELFSKLHVADISVSPLMILTSDGIHDYIDIDTLEDVICREGDFMTKCNTLINIARDKGSNDDLTVVIINSIDDKKTL